MPTHRAEPTSPARQRQPSRRAEGATRIAAVSATTVETVKSTVEFNLSDAPGHLLRRAQQLHAAVFAEVVSDPDLTTPQFAVLAALRNGSEIDQVRLSQRLAIDRSTTADVVGRLAERGLIRRKRDAKDGRRNLLSLTAAGRALHDRTAPEVAEVGRRLVEPLSEKDSKTLVRLLSAIIAVNDPFFDKPEGR